ncbi:exonuclease domain-containing protein [[Mycobacterium] kokjensenii]|uniref:Exonuclease domain-containing protein n=1 Tax=[Mycobacterium] kokjensenii TaxID=3064287 RepID=A0ABM9LEV6_9MYCO|nr:exonuclease domain-containing protein [Mycolicibacter sp. MU0083]CAJ1497769.1 exonuclease domain-containing protein [Mycolicibacter sp. MU0083]
MTWTAGPFLALDLETTGTDPWADRIVTASLVEVTVGAKPATASWLLNPGIPIPAGAEAVHGISTAQAVARGVAPADALAEITARVAAWLAAAKPVVAFNASFDLTMLEAENARHGIPTLVQRLSEIRPVIDPLVLDKEMDTYRRGKRTLPVLADLYGVALERAHSSDADAVAAALLVPELTARYPALGAYSLDELHDAQQLWRKEHQLSLANYFERQGYLDAVQSMRYGWPTESR